MESQIAAAIQNRFLLSFYYDPGVRSVEPHALGISADGHLLLRAYQVGGASSSGESTNWKLFRLEKITSLEITNRKFAGPRPGYNPNDPVMKRQIIARL